jgi:hypothetical protein
MQLPWPQHDDKEVHGEARQPAAAAAAAAAGTKAKRLALMPHLLLLMATETDALLRLPQEDLLLRSPSTTKQS